MVFGMHVLKHSSYSLCQKDGERERESKILTIAKCWHGWGLTMIAASRNSEFRIRIVTIVGICWCHSDYFISSTFSHKTIKRKLISPVFFNYLASHSLCLKLFQWSTLYEYWIATEYFFPYRMYKKKKLHRHYTPDCSRLNFEFSTLNTFWPCFCFCLFPPT